MAYLHCHSCDWSQDDFYSVEGYNPAKSLKDWMETLCSDKANTIIGNENKGTDKEITYQETIAREFERYATSIRNMKWITFEQWKREKDTAVCPKCGAQNFDID